MRLKFWLFVMGAIVFCGGFGSRLYLFAVQRAADAAERWES